MLLAVSTASIDNINSYQYSYEAGSGVRGLQGCWLKDTVKKTPT